MGKITTIFLSIIFSLFLLEIILLFTPLKKKVYKGFPINYYEKNSDYGYDIKKNTKNFIQKSQANKFLVGDGMTDTVKEYNVGDWLIYPKHGLGKAIDFDRSIGNTINNYL